MHHLFNDLLSVNCMHVHNAALFIGKTLVTKQHMVGNFVFADIVEGGVKPYTVDELMADFGMLPRKQPCQQFAVFAPS